MGVFIFSFNKSNHSDPDPGNEAFEYCPECGEIIGNGCTCERCPECGEIIGNGCTCERCPECGEIIGNGCTCERCPECGELVSNCSCNPTPNVYGSDILVSGGFFYNMNNSEYVENTEFNGIYHLVDVTATGFSKIWKHETLNYWIFYCSQTWSCQWRFTPYEPNGYDTASDFLITDRNTTKWPWEDDTWEYNSGYSTPGYIIPKIYGGPNAGD